MVTIEEIWKKVVDSWNKFEDWVSTGLTGIWAVFQPLIDELYSLLYGFWQELYGMVDEFINTIGDIGNDIQVLFTDVGSIPDKVWGWVSGNVESLIAGVEGRVSGWIDIAISNLNYITDAALDPIRSSIDYIVSEVSGFYDRIASVTDNFNMLMDYFEDFVRSAIETILDRIIETEEESEEYKKGV